MTTTTNRPGICSYDTGSAFGNAPMCGSKATHTVTYRNGGTFTVEVCGRHLSPMRGRVFPGLVEVAPIGARSNVVAFPGVDPSFLNGRRTFTTHPDRTDAVQVAMFDAANVDEPSLFDGVFA